MLKVARPLAKGHRKWTRVVMVQRYILIEELVDRSTEPCRLQYRCAFVHTYVHT